MSRRSRATCCSGRSRDCFQIAMSAPLKAGALRQPSLSARNRTAVICAVFAIAAPPTVLPKTYICLRDIGQVRTDGAIRSRDLLYVERRTYTRRTSVRGAIHPELPEEAR